MIGEGDRSRSNRWFARLVAEIERICAVPSVFWWVALVGVLAVSSCFIVFRPVPLNIFFIGGYSDTIGVVLYFVPTQESLSGIPAQRTDIPENSIGLMPVDRDRIVRETS